MNAPRKKILSGKSLVLHFRIFWALKHWKSPNLRLNLYLVLGSPDPNSRYGSLILGLPDPKIRDLTLESGTSGNASIVDDNKWLLDMIINMHMLDIYKDLNINISCSV